MCVCVCVCVHERERNFPLHRGAFISLSVLQNVQDYEQGPGRKKVKLIWTEKVNGTKTLFLLLSGVKNNGETDPEAKGHFCDT